jgi:hypothetical protein
MKSEVGSRSPNDKIRNPKWKMDSYYCSQAKEPIRIIREFQVPSHVLIIILINVLAHKASDWYIIVSYHRAKEFIRNYAFIYLRIKNEVSRSEVMK